MTNPIQWHCDKCRTVGTTKAIPVKGIMDRVRNQHAKLSPDCVLDWRHVWPGPLPLTLEEQRAMTNKVVNTINTMLARAEAQNIMHDLIAWIDKFGGERSRGEGRAYLKHAIEYLRKPINKEGQF